MLLNPIVLSRFFYGEWCSVTKLNLKNSFFYFLKAGRNGRKIPDFNVGMFGFLLIKKLEPLQFRSRLNDRAKVNLQVIIPFYVIIWKTDTFVSILSHFE